MAQQEDSPFGLHSVDNSDLSVLFDETDFVAVSDDRYAQELQFQEILMASLITSHNAPPPPPSSSSSSPPPPSLCLGSSSKSVEVSRLATKTELDADDLLIICEICAEAKQTHEMFRNQRCDHSFCYDCVTKQVATKIQDNITVVSCPGLNCKGVLELDVCRPMLPKDLIERWDDALCEAFLLTAPKFYCPFRDCSFMMLDDNEGEDIRESECPFCHRLFCVRCHVPWHPGVDCEEFQTLNEDEKGREDLLVRELANEKKWSRCPKCKFYVEKTEGCLHITCRCRFHFCYDCGKEWTFSTHSDCQEISLI